MRQDIYSQIQRISGKRPVVFLLPGLMGSRLVCDGREIWPSPVSLVASGATNLAIDCCGILPSSLVNGPYSALSARLRQTADVIEFAYDWRRSLADEARHLDQAVRLVSSRLEGSGQPVRFLGHSMGGMLARVMITRHRDTWVRLCNAQPGVLLTMLGTPNGGSMSIVRTLLGLGPVIRTLRTCLGSSAAASTLALLSQLPGFLELLPSGWGTDYLQQHSWEPLEAVTPAGWAPPPAQALQAARKLRQDMVLRKEDAGRIVMISGQAAATPIGLRATRSGLQILTTIAGDGRVPWQTSHLAGVARWYAPGVAHGALPRNRMVQQAVVDLFTSGQTETLPQIAPGASHNLIVQAWSKAIAGLSMSDRTSWNLHTI
ncbi:MAG: hypothetical protein AAFR19_07345 [Pseudomonadota bacterium]